MKVNPPYDTEAQSLGAPLLPETKIWRCLIPAHTHTWTALYISQFLKQNYCTLFYVSITCLVHYQNHNFLHSLWFERKLTSSYLLTNRSPLYTNLILFSPPLHFDHLLV